MINIEVKNARMRAYSSLLQDIIVWQMISPASQIHNQQ